MRNLSSLLFICFSELWNWHFLVRLSPDVVIVTLLPFTLHLSVLSLCWRCSWLHSSIGLLLPASHPSTKFTLSHLDTVTTYYCDSYFNLWPLSLTHYTSFHIIHLMMHPILPFTWTSSFSLIFLSFLSSFFPLYFMPGTMLGTNIHLMSRIKNPYRGKKAQPLYSGAYCLVEETEPLNILLATTP